MKEIHITKKESELLASLLAREIVDCDNAARHFLDEHNINDAKTALENLVILESILLRV